MFVYPESTRFAALPVANLTQLVSIESARLHVGLDSTDASQDTFLDELLFSAEELVSKHVGRPLVDMNMVERYGEWGEGLILSGRTQSAAFVTPRKTLTVQYYDVDNAQQDLTLGTDFVFDDSSDKHLIQYVPSWQRPVLTSNLVAPIKVTYTNVATLNAWGAEAIKGAIRYYILALYPGQPGELPADISRVEAAVLRMVQYIDT